MKIYTKTGDDGTTGLFGGGRVPKTHPRIEAYGTVDELNATIGAARSIGATTGDFDMLLQSIQQLLFVLGGDLATPLGSKVAISVPRIVEANVHFLEEQIDKYNGALPELRRFILPGGGKLASLLHVSRTVARRTERTLVALAATETIGEWDIRFMNRLSDLLFVLARCANHLESRPDVEWDPSTT